MAVSKSYNQNKPINYGFSNPKGFFTNLSKTQTTHAFQNNENKPIHDLSYHLAELDHHHRFAITQENSYHFKTIFNHELSDEIYIDAAILLQNGNINPSLLKLEEALQLNPENLAARFTYARLLSEKGKTDESLEHFRLANKIQEYQNNSQRRKIHYLHPLYQSFRQKINFLPSFSGTTPSGSGNFFKGILKIARVACLLGVLAFTGLPVAEAIPAEQQEGMGTTTLKAYVMDENSESWNETISAYLYRGAVHPDSLIKTGFLNQNGELTLEDINTGVKTAKLPEGSYKTYPTVFDQQAIIALQLEERADVTITLYDVTARQVWRTQLQDVYPGLLEEEIPGRGLANGAYIAEVLTNHDGEIKKGASKIIKQSGAQTGYKTGMPLEKSAYATQEGGRFIMVLDGDFAEETIIEGISLPSGETTDLGTIEVDIDPTEITGTVKDQNGDNWDAPQKATAYENDIQLGENELADGQIQVPIYIKKPTTIKTNISGPEMQGVTGIEKTIMQAGIIDLGEIVIDRTGKNIVIGPVFDVETAWNGLDAKEPTKLAGMKVYVYSNGTEIGLTTGTDGTTKIHTTQLPSGAIDSVIVANPGIDTTWYEWKRIDVAELDTITAYFDNRGIPLFKQEMLPGQGEDINPLYNEPPFNCPTEGMDLLDYIILTREGSWPGQPIEGAMGRFPDWMLPIKICITHSEDGREPANENYTLGARDAIAAVSIGRFQFQEVPLEEAIWKFDMYDKDYGSTNSFEYIEIDNQGKAVYTHMEGAFTWIRGPPTEELSNRKEIAILFAHELLQPAETEYSPYIEDNFYPYPKTKLGTGAPVESYRENRATKIQYDMANMVRFKDYGKDLK